MTLDAYKGVPLDAANKNGVYALAAALYSFNLAPGPFVPASQGDPVTAPGFADKVYQKIISTRLELVNDAGVPVPERYNELPWYASLPSTLIYTAILFGLPYQGIRVHYSPGDGLLFSTAFADDVLEYEIKLIESLGVVTVGPQIYTDQRLPYLSKEIQLLVVKNEGAGYEGLHWIALLKSNAASSAPADAYDLYDPVSGYAGPCTINRDPESGVPTGFHYSYSTAAHDLIFDGVWIQLSPGPLPKKEPDTLTQPDS